MYKFSYRQYSVSLTEVEINRSTSEEPKSLSGATLQHDASSLPSPSKFSEAVIPHEQCIKQAYTAVLCMLTGRAIALRMSSISVLGVCVPGLCVYGVGDITEPFEVLVPEAVGSATYGFKSLPGVFPRCVPLPL